MTLASFDMYFIGFRSTMPRQNSSKDKENKGSSTGTSKPKVSDNEKPKPNNTILNIVSAGDVSHMKVNKLSEVDKILEGHLSSVSTEARPHSGSTDHKKQSVLTEASSQESNQVMDKTDKESSHNGTRDKQPQKSTSPGDKENTDTSQNAALQQQVQKAKQVNQDNIQVGNRRKKTTNPPIIIPHDLSASESESGDPRQYRWAPSSPIDLTAPGFDFEYDQPDDSAYATKQSSFAPKRKSAYYPDRAAPIRKRHRWPTESFFDPQTGTEYMPVYTPQRISNPRPREYYYPRPRPLYTTYPYGRVPRVLKSHEKSGIWFLQISVLKKSGN